MKMLRYRERAKLAQHPLSRELFLLMEHKKSNLGLSADVTNTQKLIELIHATGKYICILKTHVDILEDFSESFILELQALSKKYNFLIFEDRKFADIGNTVQYQYEKGLYKIADWAHITNAHVLPGEGIIRGLKQVGQPRQRGLLLLAQMSSAGNLLDTTYTQKTIEMAKAHQDFVIGFITRQKLTDEPHFIHFTPGIQWKTQGDNLGQQYITPEEAILQHQTDVILVGRGIYEAPDTRVAAKEYQESSWTLYKKRIS